MRPVSILSLEASGPTRVISTSTELPEPATAFMRPAMFQMATSVPWMVLRSVCASAADANSAVQATAIEIRDMSWGVVGDSDSTTLQRAWLKALCVKGAAQGGQRLGEVPPAESEPEMRVIGAEDASRDEQHAVVLDERAGDIIRVAVD